MKRILVFLTIATCSIWDSFAQSGSVEGTITDAKTGETLIGCNVLMQGTTKGTVTDLDGHYVLDNLSAGIYNLVVSYISYDQ